MEATDIDHETTYARAIANVCARARAAGVPEEDIRAFIRAWERSRSGRRETLPEPVGG